MKKKVAKAVIITSAIVILMTSAFVFGYSPSGLTQTPQPETGRIYPLNRRGGVVGYMTHREKILQQLSLGICVFFVVVAASTEYYLDPFDRRKQPWDRSRRPE